jgi:hypothetical protein
VPDHAVGRALGDLEIWVASFADVHREVHAAKVTGVHFYPRRSDALPMTWLLLGDDEVILEAGKGGGGRWELPRTPDGVALLRQLVEGIVAGRVVETFGPRRSCVTVTLADGTQAAETGYIGWRPVPGWKRRGPTVQYTAYR